MIRLTIVAPSVADPADSALVTSWRLNPSNRFDVQFVFLINSKLQPSTFACQHEKHSSHSILYVPSDRYFGSCEENISRLGDFIDLLGEYILIVGEHDAIDWVQLEQALDVITSNQLDALAININCCQKKPDQSFEGVSAFARIETSSRASMVAKSLLDGNVLSSQIAFPALISCFGPIDWAAYIGSHIYTRETLRRVLMYKRSEWVYSLVYNQLQFFCESGCRYGLFDGMPVTRISDDFLKVRQNRHSWGWLENHRTVRGLSPCFWIANLESINEIDDPALISLVVYSYCLSIVPGEDGSTLYRHHPFLRSALHWCLSAIEHKLKGRSYYFAAEVASGGLGDLYTISRFLKKFIRIAETNSSLPRLHKPCFLSLITAAFLEIHSFLIQSAAETQSLVTAYNNLRLAAADIKSEELALLNDYSFICFEKSRILNNA